MVAHPQCDSSSTIPGRIGTCKCWFLRREENRSTGRKTSRGEERTNNKLKAYMASLPLYEHGPHWSVENQNPFFSVDNTAQIKQFGRTLSLVILKKFPRFSSYKKITSRCSNKPNFNPITKKCPFNDSQCYKAFKPHTKFTDKKDTLYLHFTTPPKWLVTGKFSILQENKRLPLLQNMYCC